MVDYNISALLFCIQALLLQKEYRQIAYSNHYCTNNKTYYLSKYKCADAKAEERHSDTGCRINHKSASYPHKFKGLLKPLEYREIILTCIHYYLKNSGNVAERQTNAMQPPKVSMIVFFTS